MLSNFSLDYEICSCRGTTIEDIHNAVKNLNAENLGDIQKMTKAGTACKYCLFKEADFGKIKKKVYCNDLFRELKNGK